MPADNKFWERIFKGLNHELEWLESADRLKHGADSLFAAYLESCKLSPEDKAETEDRNLAGVATLLYGLAMENILKAVLLKTKTAKIKSDGSIEWNAEGAKEHDLVSICRSTKLTSLNADQEKLMERMSAFVHWAGKYPTPLTFKDTRTGKEFQGIASFQINHKRPQPCCRCNFAPKIKQCLKRFLENSLGKHFAD